MKKMKSLFLIVATLVSACTSMPVTAPLPMPMRPETQQLTDKDIECMTDSAYRRLVQRDISHKNYQGRLEAVIKSTWNK